MIPVPLEIAEVPTTHKITYLTVFGLLVNAVFARVWNEAKHGSIDGSPVWAWHSSGLYQLVLMPPCLLFGLLEKGNAGGLGAVWEYLHCSWADAGDGVCGSMHWEELLGCILLTYFIRDTVVLLRDPKANIAFLVHHAATMLFSYTVLTMGPKQGVVISLMGSTCMEFGSYIMQVHKFDKASEVRMKFFYWGMTVSNFIATVLIPVVVVQSWQAGLIDLTQRSPLLILLLDVIVGGIRQYFVEGDLKEFYSLRTAKKGEGAPAHGLGGAQAPLQHRA